MNRYSRPQKLIAKNNRSQKNVSSHRAIVFGAICGIAGTIIGSVANGLVTHYVERQKQRDLVMLESYKWSQQDGPLELLHVKLLFDQMRNLTYASDESISRQATLLRKHPECATTLSEKCKTVMVETIRIGRADTGSGSASPEDIDTLLTAPYKKAEAAVHTMQNINRSPLSQ